MSKVIMDIQELSVSYEGELALDKASLPIHANDFIGVIGPNGGGKTTLVKAILKLVKPSGGKIVSNISKHELGYLPQINQLDKQFPIKVLDVVRSGMPGKLINFGTNNTNTTRAKQLLEEVGALHLCNDPFGKLSGGWMQRVLLCRALMSQPKLLILDEPDTYVDSQFETDLYEKLHILNKEMAILLVSHDVGTISSYVKTIACVNKQLHYHPSNVINSEQLASYNCPLQIITHGDVPHTVLSKH